MKFARYFAQIIIGMIFAFLASMALSPFFASFAGGAGAKFAIVVGILIAVFISISPNLRRCFGRSFLFLGAAIFLLPLSTLILSGAVLNETVQSAAEPDKGLAIIGGVLAGGAITGFATFFGIITGSVFLIFGLVLSLGGMREVTVVGRR